MDTGVLARVLDDVLAYGGDYRIDRLDVGRAHDDESYARIEVSAADDDGRVEVTSAGGTGDALRFTLARAARGALRLSYTVPAAPPSFATRGVVEVDPDRIRAQGEAFLALPADDYRDLALQVRAQVPQAV